jgi:hypothetical protein
MSLRRIDPRFVLPRRPATAVVLGDLEEWRRGLEQTGVDVVAASPRKAPDLTVAPAQLAHPALATGAQMLLLEGRLPRELRLGAKTRQLLARPDLEQPSLLIPLDEPLVSCYAVSHWSVLDRPWKVARMRVALELLRRRRFPPVGSVVAAVAPDGGPPFMVAAAAEHLDLPVDTQWLLTLGQGDALSRNVFHLFPRAERAPTHVLKFARVPGHAEPFERDARGLAIAAQAGGRVAEHAPRFLGRFEHDGINASVETAAVGHRLRDLLLRPGRRDEKLRLIETIAEWVLDVARETAGPADSLVEERERLTREVVPHWLEAGVARAVVATVPPVAAVLQHNDLGSWNIVVDRHRFTALDWESARERGLPLWDLFYFLADALAVLDGSVAGETRHIHTTRLFRGDLASSSILFEWTRRGVEQLEIPSDAVGRIATLCWLHHSLSPVRRRAAIDVLARGAAQPVHGTENVAAAWLSEPGLGEDWDRWRR